MPKPKLTIVKIGGNVIDNAAQLEKFLTGFVTISGNKMLVHGGGKIASNLSTKLGIEPKFHEGRRITDADSLEVAVMVYAGLTNKKITAILQSLSCNAIGLSGCDGNLLQAEIRPKVPIDFGFVGDIDKEHVNINLLDQLVSSGITPVVSAITHDGTGNLLNTNADTIASVLAQAMSELYDTELYYCFEKPGVMMDVNDDKSLIESLSYSKYLKLREESVIDKGMIPKLDNSFDALKAGVERVVICSSEDLADIILKSKSKGTSIEF